MCSKGMCTNCRTLCYMSFFEPPTPEPQPPSPKPSPASLQKDTNIRVITVEFNAWEYSGCDQLWAGIVTNLGTTVEEYFGTWKVRLCRLLLRRSDDSRPPHRLATSLGCSCCYLHCKIYMLMLCVLLLLVMSIAALVMYGTAASDDELKDLTKAPLVVAVTSLLGTMTVVVAGWS